MVLGLVRDSPRSNRRASFLDKLSLGRTTSGIPIGSMLERAAFPALAN